MKKKLILAASFCALSVNRLFAQDMFGSFAKDMKAEVEDYFPTIVGIVFVVSALFNLGKFFGEHRDIKQGISNILIFVGGVCLVMGVYHYLSGTSL